MDSCSFVFLIHSLSISQLYSLVFINLFHVDYCCSCYMSLPSMLMFNLIELQNDFNLSIVACTSRWRGPSHQTQTTLDPHIVPLLFLMQCRPPPTAHHASYIFPHCPQHAVAYPGQGSVNSQHQLKMLTLHSC